MLVLAYRFPPQSNAIASRRPEGLYYHLPEFGWESTVITTQNECGLPNVIAVPDRSLAGRRETAETFDNAVNASKQSNAGAWGKLRGMAKRIAKLSPAAYDAYARWSWDAADAAIQAGRAQRFDAVWATLSPMSLGPAAIKVAGELALPCILDLRDPPDEALGSGPHGWFRKALAQANAVTFAAPSCITPYVLEHCASPLLVLSGAWSASPIAPKPSAQFRIVHAGTWHPHYDAVPLAEALRTLRKRDEGFAQATRLVFVGKGSSTVPGNPAFAQLPEMLEVHPLLPHEHALSHVETASVLLIARSSNGYKSRAITGKIFEYASYQTPLLSTGGENDLHAGLVRWMGGTWSCDATEIAEILHDLYLQWTASGAVTATRTANALAYLSQQRMAAETATVLRAALEQRGPELRGELPWPQ
ncbi:MAG: hypothetical protein M3R04_04740 [bacterium]|nr:hypothetical protein [bacterium]